MRTLVVFGAFSVALFCFGCDAKTQKAMEQEVIRFTIVTGHGPKIVASIVGASTPTSGNGGLNGLCMDEAWRMVFAKACPSEKNYHVPSMFEIPDPNRPAKISAGRRQ